MLSKLRTSEGLLNVEINPPDAVVEVLNARNEIEIIRPGAEGKIVIFVDAGKHQLKITKDGYSSFAKDFEIASGEKSSIKATLSPIKTDKTESPPPIESSPADERRAAQ